LWGWCKAATPIDLDPRPNPGNPSNRQPNASVCHQAAIPPDCTYLDITFCFYKNSRLWTNIAIVKRSQPKGDRRDLETLHVFSFLLRS
jgi:hypothetical protein